MYSMLILERVQTLSMSKTVAKWILVFARNNRRRYSRERTSTPTFVKLWQYVYIFHSNLLEDGRARGIVRCSSKKKGRTRKNRKKGRSAAGRGVFPASSKLWETHSRLYRSQILQVNNLHNAFLCTVLYYSKLKIFVKNCWFFCWFHGERLR